MMSCSTSSGMNSNNLYKILIENQKTHIDNLKIQNIYPIIAHTTKSTVFSDPKTSKSPEREGGGAKFLLTD
uniref:Uncharacterized protein n=1 Tax=Rhizophora mucronata TaxID=61149 RepID=A0A2P2KK67_RHIMU